MTHDQVGSSEQGSRHGDELSLPLGEVASSGRDLGRQGDSDLGRSRRPKGRHSGGIGPIGVSILGILLDQSVQAVARGHSRWRLGRRGRIPRAEINSV
jgi:hypothetical protein